MWSRLKSLWHPSIDTPDIVIPGDVTRSIASAYDLNITDIVHLCKTQRQFNNAICRNDEFWRQLAKERLTDMDLHDKSITELKHILLDAERDLQKFASSFKYIPFQGLYEKRFVEKYTNLGYEKVLGHMMDIITSSQFVDAREGILHMIVKEYVSGRGNNLTKVWAVLQPYFPDNLFIALTVGLIFQAVHQGLDYTSELLPYISPNNERFVDYIEEYLRRMNPLDQFWLYGKTGYNILRSMIQYVNPELRDKITVPLDIDSSDRWYHSKMLDMAKRNEDYPEY